MPPPKPKPNRKRSSRPKGGQPGNTNRLTHGLYSRHVSVQLARDLESMPTDHNQAELLLARSRLDAVLEKQSHAPPELWLDYERAAYQYLRAIGAMLHKNAVLGRDSRSSFVTVMEMIRVTNEEQHVA